MPRVSDVFCPARIMVRAVLEGELDEAANLAALLRPERVARVFTSDDVRALQLGAMVAAALGVSAQVLDGLDSDPRTVLEDIADRHRGETVLVVSDAVLPWVPGLDATRSVDEHGGPAPSPSALVSIEIDADGWRVTSS